MSAPQTIVALLDRAARAGGSGPAVLDRGRTMSYAELDRMSNRLAHALVDHGVRPGDRVGLLLEKSIESLVGIYATLKAGAAYVPLDDQSPARRLGYVARDAAINCLICDTRGWLRCGELIEHGAPLTTVFGPAAETAPGGPALVDPGSVRQYPDRPPEVHSDADALAYILYTSGSTGEPKGVMLSHRNALAFVNWAATMLGIGPQDRLSSHAPLHFDLSTFDLFAAAHGRAPVVLVPREASVFPIELANFIRDSGITVWYSVPSALTMLVQRGELENGALEGLRSVIFAGEVFPAKHLRALMTLVPGARYYNFYGPTETNVCTWYEVPAGRPPHDDVPIGAPIPGVTATVVRDGGAVAARGERGELLIAGPTVMHGYWGDEQRTARVLSRRGDERIYRTGDLVREDADGLRFLGRRDSQVKTRGYRVELSEVESALNAVSTVLDCAVVAVPDDAVTNRLKAYVVCSEQISAAELAGRCAERLPRHMIPDEFVFVTSLPRSSTGKVDRRALTVSMSPVP